MELKFFSDVLGEEKLLSIWFFLCWGAVIVVIVGSSMFFYSLEVDVRPIEAKLLSEKIYACLSEGMEVEDSFFDDDFDIYSFCGLEKRVFEEGVFYFNVSLIGSDGKIIHFHSSLESSSFEERCLISEGIEGDHSVFCKELNYSVSYKGEFLDLNILTVSNNEGVRF